MRLEHLDTLVHGTKIPTKKSMTLRHVYFPIISEKLILQTIKKKFLPLEKYFVMKRGITALSIQSKMLLQVF